ncbi:hypothetical protein [Rivibacter subsaxonicus]|uniref:Uncharacterized protein n=1 Tax=Rivibacter subsaxonicus TaxID=457575 RepID=A0A4Q7W1Q6_9BURK|nr:hypothetical protein [Rivibacter subsaxonicus]RZU02775.1 hypothetical protein EV670_0804 [Rivibacter subsaxonicus]
MNPSPVADPTAALLRDFDRRYLRWGLPLCLACLLAVAWLWSQPGKHNLGAPFWQAVQLLAAAAALLNLPSWWLQRRSLRAQLERAAPIGAWRFALRFWLINLALAVALSVLLWRPLLNLLFFFRLYPVAFWLLPWHAILGLMLGRWLQLQASPAPVPPAASR